VESNRRAFIKKSCGVCSCLGAMFLLDGPAHADEKSEKELKQRLEQSKAFAGAWTTSLINSMDKELDNQTRSKILQACGRACAQRNSAPLIKSFPGKLDGLLAKMKEMWLESYAHDAKKGLIVLTGRKSDKCPCPIHPAKGTKSYCECANGHMDELFSKVIGKPVKVELIESVLGGNQRCSWRISY
jgi:predicted hydrocarbon binding protein